MIPLCEVDVAPIMTIFRGVARRVVMVSSQDVYRAYGKLIGIESGAPERTPLTEDSPLRHKLHPYRGESARTEDDPARWMDDYDKIPVEGAFMGNPELPGTVLRLPMVYGPGDRQHRIFPYLKRMNDDRPAILLGEGMATWRCTRGYVGNVAAAVALAVTDERATGRIYNVGEASCHTEVEWVRTIADASEWRGKILALPEDRLPPHLKAGIATAQNLDADTSRIREELDYEEPVDAATALASTVEWERAHPPDRFDPADYDYGAEDRIIATCI